MITEQQFPAGVYRVEFDTKSYWKNEGSTPFHDVADVSIKKRRRHTSMSPDRPPRTFVSMLQSEKVVVGMTTVQGMEWKNWKQRLNTPKEKDQQTTVSL